MPITEILGRPVTEWSKETGNSPETILARLRRGATPEEAVRAGVDVGPPRALGSEAIVGAIARIQGGEKAGKGAADLGVSYPTLYRALASAGFSVRGSRRMKAPEPAVPGRLIVGELRRVGMQISFSIPDEAWTPQGSLRILTMEIAGEAVHMTLASDAPFHWKTEESSGSARIPGISWRLLFDPAAVDREPESQT
jgi:hypothetical protein